MKERIPVFAPDLMENCPFDPSRLERLSRLEKSHFWFEGRRLLIKRIVREYFPKNASIADLGCGTGSLLEELLQSGYEMIGVDLHVAPLARLQKKWPTSLFFQASVENVPLADASCDGVLLLDVLEHVDDQQTLKETHRLLKKSGWVVISVPAHQWLWSVHDERAGHRRRYSFRALQTLLEQERFKIESIRYYQNLLFPLFAFSRWMSRVWPKCEVAEEMAPPFLNRFFSLINRWEARLKRGLPFGSSLIALGRKM